MPDQQQQPTPTKPTSRAWMITFADLMSLLLTFFVLLFSMSQVKLDAWHALVQALSERLNPSVEWTDPTLRFDTNTPEVDRRHAVDLSYLQRILEEKIATDPLLSRGLVLRLDDRLLLSLPADLLFAPGRADPTPAARNAATVLASALAFVANQLEVQGHTDPDPVSGSGAFASNWELSLARATAIANAISAGGYGLPIHVFGLADSRFFDLSTALGEPRRMRLARRVDLILRENPARAE